MIEPGSQAKTRRFLRISGLLLIAIGLSTDPAAHAQKQKPALKEAALDVRIAMAIQKQDEPKVRALLQAGADVNRRNEYGFSPLDYAADIGSVPICRLLVERGAKINPTGKELPPLYHALAGNRMSVVRLLLEKGASLKWESADVTPLQVAASADSAPLIDLLLKQGVPLDPAALLIAAGQDAAAAAARLLEAGADPNVRNEEGETPLIVAAQKGKPGVLEVLLKHKADVNAKDAVGKTALKHASGPARERIIARLKQAGAQELELTLAEAIKQGDTRTLRALLGRGSDANEADAEGRTPLFHAVVAGDENLVKALLEKGADPEARDKKGKSVISVAREAGSRQAIDLLLAAGVESPEIELSDALMQLDLPRAKKALAAGADVNAVDENGRPMLLIAISMGSKTPPMEVIDLLLERGADVNATSTRNGERILHSAVASGNVELVRKLLERGANPKEKDDSDYTPLHYLDDGDDAIARLLIERGADVRARTTSGHTVLMSVAADGKPETLRLILEHGAAADLKAKDESGFTALHSAAGSGNAANVKLLLERGADLKAVAASPKLTPLGSAVSGYDREGDYITTVRLLLGKGADPNTQDDSGRPILEAAKRGGMTEIVTLLKSAGARSSPPPSSASELTRAVLRSDYLTAERLLKAKKIDPNRAEGDNYTPLMTASLRGDLDMVKLLLAHGAQPNRRYGGKGGSSGFEQPSALQLAADDGEVEIVRLLLKKGADPNAPWLDETPLISAAGKGQFEACRLLIAAGATINAQAEGRRNALGAAARTRDTRVLKLLLQKGARVDAVSHGSTPLLWATAYGNVDAARILLEAGANPKARSAEGDTALMGAATAGSLELIQLLLAKGVDVNARNQMNQTALSLAEDNDHEEAAELLKRAGAKP